MKQKNYPNIARSQMSRPVMSVVLAAAVALVAGCSSTPEYVACPDVTSPVEGTNAYLLTDTAKDEIDVRFNGVNSICTRLENGDTRVDMSIGLKIKRDAKEPVADIVTLPILTAVLDADDNVVSNEEIPYKAGFRKPDEIKYPVAEVQFDVKPGQRIVISLAPAR